MDILENPFWTLGALPRSNRHQIMSLAEKQGLLSDETVVSSARNMLINPRRRLEAEIAWLPGLEPDRATEWVKQIQRDPHTILDQANIPHWLE